MASFAGEDRPDPSALTGSHAADAIVAARVGILAVTVVAVATPARRTVQIIAHAQAGFPGLVIILGQARRDRRGVGGPHTVADQLKETAVDDTVLRQAWLAVVLAQQALIVGIIVAAETQEVAAIAEGSCGREHPGFQL